MGSSSKKNSHDFDAEIKGAFKTFWNQETTVRQGLGAAFADEAKAVEFGVVWNTHLVQQKVKVGGVNEWWTWKIQWKKDAIGSAAPKGDTDVPAPLLDKANYLMSTEVADGLSLLGKADQVADMAKKLQTANAEKSKADGDAAQAKLDLVAEKQKSSAIKFLKVDAEWGTYKNNLAANSVAVDDVNKIEATIAHYKDLIMGAKSTPGESALESLIKSFSTTPTLDQWVEESTTFQEMFDKGTDFGKYKAKWGIEQNEVLDLQKALKVGTWGRFKSLWAKSWSTMYGSSSTLKADAGWNPVGYVSKSLSNWWAVVSTPFTTATSGGGKALSVLYGIIAAPFAVLGFLGNAIVDLVARPIKGTSFGSEWYLNRTGDGGHVAASP